MIVMLSIKDLENEGFSTTDNINEAIYILADGTLWNGENVCGSRTIEHREAESFSDYDRYDNEKFWNDVTINMSLIMLIPESQEVLVNPNYTPTDEQDQKINEALDLGYELSDFK
jgi:hypothetical protein